MLAVSVQNMEQSTEYLSNWAALAPAAALQMNLGLIYCGSCHQRHWRPCMQNSMGGQLFLNMEHRKIAFVACFWLCKKSRIWKKQHAVNSKMAKYADD